MGRTLTAGLLFLCLSALLVGETARKRIYGVSLNYGSFGAPEYLLDPFLLTYPAVRGEGFGINVKKYGREGLASPYTTFYSLRISEVTSGGLWRVDEEDYLVKGEFTLRQVLFAYGVHLNFFPRAFLSPYLGVGVGLGVGDLSAKGTYRDGSEEHQDSYRYKSVVPVIKVPLGLTLRPGGGVEVEVEGGFENAFYLSAGMTILL